MGKMLLCKHEDLGSGLCVCKQNSLFGEDSRILGTSWATLSNQPNRPCRAIQKDTRVPLVSTGTCSFINPYTPYIHTQKTFHFEKKSLKNKQNKALKY